MTSRESPFSGEIRSRVVDGNKIRKGLSWLYAFYETALVRIASAAWGRELVASPSSIDAININLIEGPGARYERHVDTNHVTGILFPQSLNPTDGGALVLDTTTSPVRILSERSALILFDGRELPHYVSPLERELERIVVVMNCS